MNKWKLIDENGNEIPREKIAQNPLEALAAISNDPEKMALLNALAALPDSKSYLFEYLIAGYRYYKDTPEYKGKSLEDVIKAAFNEDGSPRNSPFAGMISNAEKLHAADHAPQVRISTQQQLNRPLFDGKKYGDDKRDIYYQTGKKPDEIARVQINWGKAAEQVEHRLSATTQFYIVAAASILRTKPYTTPDEIIKLTRGNEFKPSNKDRDVIIDALDVARITPIIIQDYLSLNNPTKAEREQNVLKTVLFNTKQVPERNAKGKIVTRIYKNGDDYLDEMISEYQYKRYTTYPPEILNYPGRKDETNNALFFFFATEIARIKRRQRSNRIKYDTLYRYMNIDFRSQKKRLQERVPPMLEHFKSKGRISGFKIDADRIAIFYKPQRGAGRYKKKPKKEAKV